MFNVKRKDSDIAISNGFYRCIQLDWYAKHNFLCHNSHSTRLVSRVETIFKQYIIPSQNIFS